MGGAQPALQWYPVGTTEAIYYNGLAIWVRLLDLDGALALEIEAARGFIIFPPFCKRAPVRICFLRRAPV